MILALVLSLFATPFGAPTRPLESIARQIVIDFNARRYEAMTKDFTPDFRAQSTTSDLDALKQAITERFGTFEYIMTAKRRTLNGWPVVDVTALYSKEPAVMTVTFDDDFRVSSVIVNPIPPPPPDPLEHVARDFLANFTAGHYDAVVNRFDANMRQALPAAKLEELSRSIAKTYGPFTAVKESHISKTRDSATVALLADYNGTPVEVRVVFDRARRISGIRFAPAPKKPV